MAELRPGLVLAGRFRLSRLLGRGAAGEAWLAEDLDGGGPVSAKFCEEELAVREFEVGRRLVHPHIATVAGVWRDQGRAFVVRQFIDGESIGRLRNAGLRRMLKSLLGIADALRYAHSVGVVHRDLKPSNVLCDAQGFCWLTDFGVAAETATATKGGAPAGSLPGMSPQQLDGAAPSPSDDIYGFGALLYDLLAGAPLFHPAVSAASIREVVPALPSHTLAGEPLPASLTRLLGALLEKAPRDRPPGMAAVIQALEDVQSELAAPAEAAAFIRPRAPSAGSDAPEAGAPHAAIPALPARAGIAARTVYLAFGALVLAGVTLVMLLPRVVPRPQASAPAARTGAPTAAPSPAVSGPSPAAVPADLDAVLAELLRLQDALKKTAPERWAAVEWGNFNLAVSAGDAAYRERDLAAARGAYQRAAGIARALQARFPDALKGQLDAGDSALQAGDRARALPAFETALAMDPGSERARRGLERARRLDELLAVLAQAAAAEKNSERAVALQRYRQAAAIDPQWKAAGEGVRRMEQGAAEDAYRATMSRGYGAVAARDFPAAQAAFEAALRMRPGDAPAKSALEQLVADSRIATVTALRDQALALENQEQWPAAVKRYEEALKLDPTGAPLLEGLARSRERADISRSLEQIVANADQLNDDAALTAARAAVQRARAVRDAGPVLTRQIGEAAGLIELAAIPVDVTFESDGVTDVVIYKVGKLGAFASKTLSLKPGSYVAVGTRQGYRDVRRSFRVAGGAPAPVVNLRCEEPI